MTFALQFLQPGSTKPVCSVSASQGQNTHLRLISVFRLPTTTTTSQRQPTYSICNSLPLIPMVRRYRAHTLGICLSRSKHPPPSDLYIPASHRHNPHINTNPYTLSMTPALQSQSSGGTEFVRSVSASQGQKHPPPPDICILGSHHHNPHINTNL